MQSKFLFFTSYQFYSETNQYFCLNALNMLADPTTGPELKIKGLEIVDYCINFENQSLTFTFVNSRAWKLVTQILKWYILQEPKGKIPNVFLSHSQEDKLKTIEFFKKLKRLVQEWSTNHPKSLEDISSLSKFSLLQRELEQQKFNESDVENPYEEKKVRFEEINLQFDETFPPEAYFIMSLSVIF